MLTNHARKSKHQLMVEVFMAQMRSDAQAIPMKPTIPSLEVRKLRASLMLEECLETIRLGLGLDVIVCRPQGPVLIEEKTELLFDVIDRKPDLIQLADGLADCRVVNDGTGSAAGIALEPVEMIVMANNLSKFGPGHSFREDGKLIKPPDFKGPEKDISRELWDQTPIHLRGSHLGD